MKKSLTLTANLFVSRSLNRGFLNTTRLFSFYVNQFISHSTPLKVANALMAKSQKWLKRDHVWGMPFRYTIDPLNVCNLSCPLCPTGLGTLGRSRGLMSIDKYHKLIDQVRPYAYVVELYNWGEPFLHPDIFEMIRYSSSRRIAVRLSSNLNRFNREMAVKTIESGLDSIIVSVDGATQDTYEKYRKRGKLDRVLNNVKILVEEKKRANSRLPFITMRMIINRYNEGEVEHLREMAQQLGVDAFTTGTLFVDTTDLIQIQEWLPSKDEDSYYDYGSEKLENVWHCADLWESMTINWDGGLAPCCWLHDQKNDYENVFDRPLKEIWNGDAYISSRRVFAFGGPKEGPVTTICTVCKGRPQYLKD